MDALVAELGKRAGELGGDAVKIAIVTAGDAENASLPVIVQALQREAASLGANAVIRVRYDHGASGATATGVAVRLQQ